MQQVGTALWLLRGLLIAAASQVAQASLVVARVLSSSGSWALEHSLSSCGRVDLVVPWPVGSSQIRVKALSPALASGFLFTEPPGMPWSSPSQIWVPVLWPSCP